MTVLAIGNFDGVHLGHQRVLQEARTHAVERLVVITFWPHPVGVLRPDKAPKLIMDLHQRIAKLRKFGADEVRVVRFNQAVAAMSPEEFVEDFLASLHPKRIVVGSNFRFGARAAGDVDSLRHLAKGRFEVTAVPLSTDGDQTISSTLIRGNLCDGDVRAATAHLGSPFEYRGLVVVGDRRGRGLGFPTANLAVPDEMAVPADGVYAGWLRRIDVPGCDPLAAAISVGSNPTFDGTEHRVESYVLDRTDLSLYGAEVAVSFVERLRGQQRFADVDELIAQMHADVDKARQILH